MKIFFLTLLISMTLLAQYGQQNTSGFTEREKLQQSIEQNRKEINNSTTTSNPRNQTITPPIIIKDDGTRFAITNHLFGYSIINEKDQSLTGIKLTGFLNIAYYNVKKTNDNKRTHGRLIFGIESPIIDFNRSSIFMGGGMTIGDSTEFYLNSGIDFYLMSWFKVQGGLNYTTGPGIAPMINVGITW